MMAEFQEVMKQWVRVRKATASNLDGNVLSVYPLEDYDDQLIADIEKNAMAWAEEHPEPVYPTWMEWLTDVGAIPKAISWDEPLVEAVYDAIQEHIPADIAERLGIEPKEG